MDIPIPEHAIFLDSGNGIFWKNSRAIIVDLDGAEVRTYRFPPDRERPTKLELVSRHALSAEILGDLVVKAKAIWNPSIPLDPPISTPDLFETVYVIDGSTMATWMADTRNLAWYSDLTESIRKAAAA